MLKYFIVGGAGFIGSHLVKEIFDKRKDVQIIIYDNFSSGRIWHLEEVKNHKDLKIINADAKNKDKLIEAMKGVDIVYHFASNPDISKAINTPDIDFWEGTYITNNILEAMRINKVEKLLYTSGSGLYGDTGFLEIDENYSPLLPISTYGASKLSCEASICAYCHMFDMTAAVFRLANVVGPHQTHGVGFDFIKKLMDNPHELIILGDGNQSKSYIYVTDVISAMQLIEINVLDGFSYYNVATLDYLTVKEIADITIKVMGLQGVKYKYIDGRRGWKGDVPVVRLNSEKIRKVGWKNQYTSREAIYNSLKSIYEAAKINQLE